MRRISEAFHDILDLDHDALCKENVYLRGLHEKQETEYIYVNHIITRLRDDYTQAKDYSFFLRCRALKEMIEKAITDDQMSHVRRLAERHSDLLLTSDLLVHQSKKGAASRFSGEGDREDDEISKRWKVASAMNANQLKNDNRRRWHHIEVNRKRFQRALEQLERLHAEYGACRDLWWWERHGKMKEMIKVVIRDEMLQV